MNKIGLTNLRGRRSYMEILYRYCIHTGALWLISGNRSKIHFSVRNISSAYVTTHTSIAGEAIGISYTTYTINMSTGSFIAPQPSRRRHI